MHTYAHVYINVIFYIVYIHLFIYVHICRYIYTCLYSFLCVCLYGRDFSCKSIFIKRSENQWNRKSPTSRKAVPQEIGARFHHALRVGVHTPTAHTCSYSLKTAIYSESVGSCTLSSAGLDLYTYIHTYIYIYRIDQTFWDEPLFTAPGVGKKDSFIKLMCRFCVCGIYIYKYIYISWYIYIHIYIYMYT